MFPFRNNKLQNIKFSISARMIASCLWAASPKRQRTWTSRSTSASTARSTTSTWRPTPTPAALVDLHSSSSRWIDASTKFPVFWTAYTISIPLWSVFLRTPRGWMPRARRRRTWSRGRRWRARRPRPSRARSTLASCQLRESLLRTSRTTLLRFHSNNIFRVFCSLQNFCLLQKFQFCLSF